MSQTKKWVSFIAFAIISFTGSRNSEATPLKIGDIVVAQQSSGGIYKIDPTSGAVEQITIGGLLYFPGHVVVDYDGQIYALEQGGYNGNKPGLVKINPATGIQTMISTMSAFSLDFDIDRNLIVGSGSSTDLRKVDLKTGNVSRIATINNIGGIQDVDVEFNGNIIVLDSGPFPDGSGQIIRYNRQTSAQTVVSSEGLFGSLLDLTILPSGNFLVASGNGDLIEVNSLTGAQQLFKNVGTQGWVAPETNGDIIFADSNESISVERIRRIDGTVQNITGSKFSNGNLIGVAIFRVPEPSSMIITIIMISFVAHRCRLKRIANCTPIRGVL